MLEKVMQVLIMLKSWILLILSYNLKILNLLTGLKSFKFMTMLALEFKKVQRNNKTLYSNFYSNSKAVKQLLMKVSLMIYLNQAVILL